MSNNYNFCVNDFGKICRTCLAEGEMKLLYEKSPEKVCFIEMLNSISIEQFSEKDGLPVQICLNCESELYRTYNFAKKCIEVDKQLRKCLIEFENNKSISSQANLKIKTEIEIEEHISDTNINTELLIIKPDTPEKQNSYKSNKKLQENKILESENVVQDKNDHVGNYEFIVVKPELLSETVNNTDDEGDSEFLPENENNVGVSNIDGEIKKQKCNSNSEKKHKIPQRINIGQKSHKCKICGTSFLHAITLKEHMRIHNNEKPYVCNYCGKECRFKIALTQHMKTHMGENPYKCNICDKNFCYLKTLKEHMLIHTGKKSFVSDDCGIECKLKRNLKLHTLTHTEDKSYSATEAVKKPQPTIRAVKCIVPGCKSNTKDHNIPFFCLPQKEFLCKIWSDNLHLTEILHDKPDSMRVHMRVCCLHFEQKCFQTPSQKKLNRGAVPTIFRVINEPDLREPTVSKSPSDTSTPSENDRDEETIRN